MPIPPGYSTSAICRVLARPAVPQHLHQRQLGLGHILRFACHRSIP